MSCSLCRLPFTPSARSVRPRWPPEGMLSEKQLQYMKHAVGMGQYLVGLVVNLVHLDDNMFTINNSPVLVTIIWETGGKTFVALHTHCAMFLRHNLGLTSNTQEALIECSLLDIIVGPTQSGAHAGRLNNVDYEGVLGQGSQRVDIESLWSIGPTAGNQDFAWHEWKRRGLEWTAVRPDVFPRFSPTVLPARLSNLGERPATTADRITTLPLDVLHILLPYLSDEAYVKLMATCRTLRYHALTTFQPLARARVLRLRWAVPLESEYASYVRTKHPALADLYRQLTSAPETATHPPSRSAPSSPTDSDGAGLDARFNSLSLRAAAAAQSHGNGNGNTDTRHRDPLAHLEMAHAAHSPVDADWLHYLSQVHRTSSMRARRWVWALAGEVARVYWKKKSEGPYADPEQTPDSDGVKGRGGDEKDEKEGTGGGKGKWPGKSEAWRVYAQSVEQQYEMRRVVQGGNMGNASQTRFTW
ncbi:hypothetical protein DICSQDRAFT_178172 [Dichomitus squalens LYAD-421 SS1]|uniref:uncharacterized protein n=1 Tax=Dichomitus squalens (strain LYAD-421) TaxID=732165 RepID=UPI0004411B09|nr:uncharacterized protein DICSQDRAFT_178172 [Dichomitus squalens LYAD-421 SS1]EJF64513.1 hypothetical protein DICSQDRAFT_178172 [Dichomitus squalens LYAD-421 SS1]